MLTLTKTKNQMKINLTHRSSPRSLHCRIGFAVLFLLTIHQTAHAQASSNSVASVIAGGGGANGTIGQWDVVSMTSGTPALLGGFWNTVEVAWLRIQRTGGSVLIAWPVSFIGFQLEQSSAVGAGAAWGSVSQTVNVANGENQITISIGPSARYFRLHKP
jgi:hypothetical protein